MESVFLPAELALRAVVLNAAQRKVVEAPRGATIALTGPPASGKTTALAAYYASGRSSGRSTLVVCSHPSGVQAFHGALASLAASFESQAVAGVDGHCDIATLSAHAARWMRASYLAARVSPQLRVGDRAATRAIVQHAARGLLDMSWPLFARRYLNLDLPHLSRPDAFLDSAASLITLLQRARIGPEEFEAGCEAGLAAFYGENVERAVVLLHDPLVRERASQRGREACRAPATTLALQRAAERDVAAILAQLYREYLVAAAQADVRSPEDIVDAAIRWLSHDEASAKAIMSRYGSIAIDDADDGEPGLSALVSVLKQAGGCGLLVAGWEDARVDGFEGRRSALSLAAAGGHIELAPQAAVPSQHFERLASEAEEVSWLASQLRGLLSEGVKPDAVALLCRGSDTAATYARLLRDNGLPVSLPLDAFENEVELQDLLSLAALVQDSFAAAHLLRVLSSPLLALSDATVWTLCRDPLAAAQLALPVDEIVPSSHAGAGGTTLANNVLFGAADALLSEPQRSLLEGFRSELARWREATRGFSSAHLLAYIAAAGGFSERWQAAPAHESTRLAEDLRRLIEAVALEETGSRSSLARIAADFQGGLLCVRPARRSADAIFSSSIADAKGARWPHVFVAGVAHERFPRVYTSHAIAFSRSWGLIVRENVARGAAQTAKYAWYYAKFGAKNMYLNEERRALRYGLSRATTSSVATGFGSPPRWARDQDLLATLSNGASPSGSAN